MRHSTRAVPTRPALISAIFELGKNVELQVAMRSEMDAMMPSNDYTLQDLNKLRLLTSFILEFLRLYPPLSSLTNCYTKDTVFLGDEIAISPGT
jgi:cytochrome P450